MSTEAGRVVFTGRSLGTAQAVRSAAHIGAGMSAPANGEVVNDLVLEDFQHLAAFVKATMSYTGGATDPTLQIRLQRRMRPDLDDTDDDAWEDCASFAAIDASIALPKAVHLGVQEVSIATTVVGGWQTTLDALATDTVFSGPVPAKLRVRETVSGGDRTGGTLVYDLYLMARTNQQRD